MPVASGTAPPEREHAIDRLNPALFRAVAERSKIRNQAGKPEQERDRGVGRDRKDIPHEWTAELRPHPHGVGIGKEPVSEPGSSNVDGGKDPGCRDGKQRHRFREAVDRVAPCLPQQQENGGDQRSGITNTDPPHEVDDGEAPSDGDGHAPDANPLQKEVAHGVEQHHRGHEGDAESDEPSVGRRSRENDGTDLFGNRAESMAGFDHGSAFDLGRRFVLLVHAFKITDTAISGVMIPSTPGSGSSLPPDRLCATWYSVRLTGCNYAIALSTSKRCCWDH